ncbi:MAG: hypothetical protein K0Q72_1612 [Armatimonadetes bacterium]|jgi:hypothetical protein|nr:hypothetical protein [Armatimonadota bacterium]
MPIVSEKPRERTERKRSPWLVLLALVPVLLVAVVLVVPWFHVLSFTFQGTHWTLRVTPSASRWPTVDHFSFVGGSGIRSDWWLVGVAGRRYLVGRDQFTPSRR